MTQYIALHIAKDKKENQQRKGTQGKVQRKLATSLQESLFSEDTRMHLTPPATNTILSTRKVEVQCPRLLSGTDKIYPLLSIYQNSRLQEGKEVFSINHTVYSNSLGSVSHSYQFGEYWELSKSSSSDTPAESQQYKQVFLRTAVSSLLC